MPLLKSSELTSGRTRSLIRSPAIVGVKFKRTPNSRNWIAMAPTPLENGHGEFTAGEEARLSTVVGQQIRFGQALEVTGLPQGPDDGAHVEVRVEQEDVQEVAEHQVVAVNVRRRKLLRRASRTIQLR